MRHLRRDSGLYVAEAEIACPSRFGELPRPPRARNFVPPFGSPFQAPMATPGGAVAPPWYLSGGIALANCVAAYQPKGAASLAASYTNLANPGTYDAAPGVAPTFDAATGWTFNGSTQYLSTGIYVASGWSWILRWSGTPGGGNDIFGSYDGGDRGFSFAPAPAGAYWNLGGYAQGNAGASGVAAATNATGYYNGSSATGAIGAWSGGASALDIRIGGRNQGAPSFRAGSIQALAIYNIDITAYIAALTAAMAAL